MNSAVPYLPDCPWKKKWEGVVNFKVNLWNQSLMNDKWSFGKFCIMVTHSQAFGRVEKSMTYLEIDKNWLIDWPQT